MKYATVNKSHPQAMQLQSVGTVLGTPAWQVKEGDFLMWNFGSVYVINEILSETAKTLTVSTSPKDEPADIYTQRFLKTRLVCILN